MQLIELLVRLLWQTYMFFVGPFALYQPLAQHLGKKMQICIDKGIYKSNHL